MTTRCDATKNLWFVPVPEQTILELSRSLFNNKKCLTAQVNKIDNQLSACR